MLLHGGGGTHLHPLLEDFISAIALLGANPPLEGVPAQPPPPAGWRSRDSPETKKVFFPGDFAGNKYRFCACLVNWSLEILFWGIFVTSQRFSGRSWHTFSPGGQGGGGLTPEGGGPPPSLPLSFNALLCMGFLFKEAHLPGVAWQAGDRWAVDDTGKREYCRRGPEHRRRGSGVEPKGILSSK